jgi:hypothetical protein
LSLIFLYSWLLGQRQLKHAFDSKVQKSARPPDAEITEKASSEGPL